MINSSYFTESDLITVLLSLLLDLVNSIYGSSANSIECSKTDEIVDKSRVDV